MSAAPILPLFERYPALRRLPRVSFGDFPTPVERVTDLRNVQPGCSVHDSRANDLAGELWIKRDDLSSATIGGNKVRALEFLLAGIGPGHEVMTIGATGSTHALATAFYAHALGARTTIVRWDQEMNPDAVAVSACTERAADLSISARTAAGAYLRAGVRRLLAQGGRGGATSARLHWVPAGGTSMRGMLGHVNAALELARQVEQGEMPAPARVFVPLGSGGTAAGLLLGFAIAGLDSNVVAVRVVPRLVGNVPHVRTLAVRCARYIAALTGERVPRPGHGRIRVEHRAYGGAYGRATAGGTDAARRLRDWRGIPLDATYSAKALAAALAADTWTDSGGGSAAGTREVSTRPRLFWLTFDARYLTASANVAGIVNAGGIE